MSQHLKPGDHIFIQRYSPILYTHHGIVIDVINKYKDQYNKRLHRTTKLITQIVMVAHPVKFNSHAKFMVTSLGEFIGDLKYCVSVDITDNSYPEVLNMIERNPYQLIQKKEYSQSLHPKFIIRNALNFVREGKEYCLLTNNCEMFAEYCVTGIMSTISKQVVENVKKYTFGSEIISNINTFIVDQLTSLF